MLDLGEPVLPWFIEPDAPDPPRARLKLVYCESCGLLQLADSTFPDLLYRQFWYRSGTNATMRAEMKRLADLALSYGKTGGAWLDIGANDGTLLSYVPDSWQRVGVEPASNLTGDLWKHADEAICDYYPTDPPLHGPFDVITSAAMFYDLDDPHRFLNHLKKDLARDGVWINQLSYTPEMVRTMAFDNICHEHLCYYNLTTLQRLVGAHGLRIQDVQFNDINGGSICCVIVHADDPRTTRHYVAATMVSERRHDLEYYRAFAKRVVKWRHDAQVRVREMRAQGKRLHVYGASTKGSTLLQFCGFGPEEFERAAERSAFKWGLVTGGTRIPIVSEAESRERHPDAYFVLPWAFKEEFVAREAEYLAGGGTLIFPLPEWEEIRG